jgi:hypothetical protein
MNKADSAWTLPAAIALLAILFAIQVRQTAPPAPVGVNADRGVFSAGRARDELSNLLGDETPHPVGSAANRAVKERLIVRLTELGLRPEEQRTVGCAAESATCAQIENVLAAIPGKTADTIVLMAHYDSVPNAPGAGDDGAAVAALIEMARIVKARAPYRNTILMVFTDAEETGLLGAEAFFAEHPAAKRAKSVINLEGSGSSGPVYLLRTGPASGELMAAFRDVAPHPFAQSFTEEIFKRMPNDTDFSVSLRAGLPGIDFAFAGERNHYHTPLDSIANLDLGTLQHHGENTLPLLRTLVDADLSATAPNEVYANLGKRHWLHWSPTTGIVLAAVAVALLLFATWRARVAPLRLLAAISFGITTLVVAAGVTLAALWLVDHLVGVRPDWPANPWPWRIALFASPLLVVALVGPVAARRVGPWAMLLGTWWIWTLATLAIAVYLPLAAYLFIPGALVAAATIAAATLVARLDSPIHAAVSACVSLIAAALFLLPMAYLMEVTQGLQLAPAIIAPLGLVALVLLPAAFVDHRRIVLAATAVAFGLAFILAALVAPYSANRPQHLSFVYAHDVDAGEAHVVARSPDPLPSRITQAAPFEKSRILPWSDDAENNTTAAAEPGDAPALLPLESTDPRWHRYHITPVPGARAVALWLPEGRIAGRARIAGREVRTGPTRGSSTHRRILFFAPPEAGFDIELELVGNAPQDAWLVDIRGTLPESAQRLMTLRGVLAVPVHSGDSAATYRRVGI